MEAEALLADKAYDADETGNRAARSRRKNRRDPAKKKEPNAPEYDKALYEARHLIENFFCWVKQFRAIATRYDKTARNFLAACHVAGAIIWLN